MRCDTDFVAQSPEMVGLVERIARHLYQNEHGLLSRDEILGQKLSGTDSSIRDLIESARAKFRENISLNNVDIMAADIDSGHLIGQYIHQKFSPLTGKAVGLVKLRVPSISADIHEALSQIACGVARQAVANKLANPADLPAFLNTEYLFDSVGSVGTFLKRKSEDLQTEISLDSVLCRFIK